MIFCSRRVFLNVVTQLYDLETLVNANYFLVDQIKPTGFANIVDEPHIGSDGEVTYSPSLDFSSFQQQAMHRFFINYSKVLDVMPYFGAITASFRNDFSSPVERVISHLNNPECQISIYQELFQKKLQGNGVQIVIMQSDTGVQECGHIICQFLSEEFGADVTFVDPMYRPKTKGQLQYAGNKTRGQQHVQELRDMIFRMAIQTALDSAQFGNGIANLEAFFDNDDLTIQDMFHAYQLLFPNDQLPPGNYSIPHMKQMIIGRLLDATGKRAENKKISDLGINFYAFDQMIGEYDDKIEEDFSDIS
jgi:hypothetical protein